MLFAVINIVITDATTREIRHGHVNTAILYGAADGYVTQRVVVTWLYYVISGRLMLALGTATGRHCQRYTRNTPGHIRHVDIPSLALLSPRHGATHVIGYWFDRRFNMLPVTVITVNISHHWVHC